MGTGPRWPAALILAATVVQLAIAAFVPDLPQFEGKGFGARLVAYPAMMLLVPVIWAVRNSRDRGNPPWTAFALIMAPFLIDVTGNTADLYDSVVWWDDANHFVNWFLLCAGLGLLVARTEVAPRWALAMLIAGIGALLAIGWELGEWYTFIRHGTELGTAYEDTLGDEVLGTLGGALAGLLVAWRSRPATVLRSAPGSAAAPP
ncbi:MAG: hypothetical protein H0U09_07670 [Geodermatophilaceae bacterium]|nr:hypothetical protein [Geodermatophilaceae bacterium]